MVNVEAVQEAGHRREADQPSSLLVRFGADQPLHLDCGVDLAPFQVAYQTYGALDADRSNAILVCHALTGDQHVANRNPVTGKAGWWDIMVGPGKPIDTDRYFVISSNVLGGCLGTTGPSSTNPQTPAAAPGTQAPAAAPPAGQGRGRGNAAGHTPAYWLKVSAYPDGRFTITNARNGFSKTYEAKARAK